MYISLFISLLAYLILIKQLCEVDSTNIAIFTNEETKTQKEWKTY